MSSSVAAQKFDPARAGEYQSQSRIALAGYDACHELAACMLAAVVGPGTSAHVLVVGAGGGAQEIVTAGALEPAWRFTAVDPSQPMMDIAVAQLQRHGLDGRTEKHLGYVDDLPDGCRFDAATLIGVLHHLPGDEAKRHILRSIASRLAPGAPLILAGNRYGYADHPMLLAAWGERWRMQGSTPDEVQAKLGKILQGADPPVSEEAVAALLGEARFEKPTWFFSSLFWGACLARRASDDPPVLARSMPRKPDCTDAPARRVLRMVDEDARDRARVLQDTPEFARSRRLRRRIERLFGHLKRSMGLRRLTLRGLRGAAEEFAMAAAAQNLILLTGRRSTT